MELLAPLMSAAYYAKRAEKFLKPRTRRISGPLGFGKRLRIAYVPLGVVGYAMYHVLWQARYSGQAALSRAMG